MAIPKPILTHTPPLAAGADLTLQSPSIPSKAAQVYTCQAILCMTYAWGAKPDVGVHTCNPRSREPEAGGFL